MSASMEEQTQLIRRVQTRERTALVLSLVFTAVPVLLVGTVLGLSVHWIKAADRAVGVAREEVARYQRLVALGHETPTELAKQVLQLQTQLADKEQQINLAQAETGRLQQLLNARSQPDSELMYSYKQALEQNRQILEQKTAEVAAAREAERKLAQQALASQEKSYKEQLDGLRKEIEGLKKELGDAKALGDKYFNDAQNCQRNITAAEGRAAKSESALKECQSALGDCRKVGVPDSKLEEALRLCRSALQQRNDDLKQSEQNYAEMKKQNVEAQHKYDELKQKCGKQ